MNKESIAILGSNQGEIRKEAGGKFNGANLIFDRILWDKALDKSEFKVGYEDRFLGIMEVPFSDFAGVSDIPSHRIKYFKRNGEIVWDRVKKINIL